MAKESSMFKDGTYSAWYKSSLGEGTGTAYFVEGKLWGRDSILFYDGTYEVAGDNLTIMLKTRRHSAGQASIFGVDEFEMKLEGTVLGKTVVCSGTADVAPDVMVEVTLIPCKSEPTSVEPPPAPRLDARLDASKLPTLPKLSRGR
jgi:hypothetical protein